jgi:hypothetical protein
MIQHGHEKGPKRNHVVITFFCDFRWFWAKKERFFLQNQCYDPNFTKLAVF